MMPGDISDRQIEERTSGNDALLLIMARVASNYICLLQGTETSPVSALQSWPCSLGLGTVSERKKWM